MQLLLAVIALTSLILNVLIYLRLRSQEQGVVLMTDEEWAPGALSLGDPVLSQVTRYGEPYGAVRCPVCFLEDHSSIVVSDGGPETEAPSTIASASETSHQAWVNRKNIPLTETVYVPATPVPIAVPGPLQRPAGFV